VEVCFVLDTVSDALMNVYNMTFSFIHGRWIWSTKQEYCM